MSRPAADRAARLAPGNSSNRPAPAPATPSSSAKTPRGERRRAHPQTSAAARATAAGTSAERLRGSNRTQTGGTPGSRDSISSEESRSAQASCRRKIQRRFLAAGCSQSPASPTSGSASYTADFSTRSVRSTMRGKVTVDGLTKSLRAAESRLRQQHGDRRIDFDVVIKDGKAVVKPIVR